MRRFERARLIAKSLEFRLPPAIAGALMAFAGVPSPYRPIDHQLRCIFVHVPKAAGTSVARALFNEKSRHIPISRYFAFDAHAASSYFKFAFVRNPWARLYSAYHYLARRVGSDPRYPDHRWSTHYLGGVGDFDGFLQRMRSSPSYRRAVRRYIHFRDQLDWVSLAGDNGPAIDFVGRYEHVARDFAIVAARLGADATLPNERIGTHRDFREHFTSRDIAFVGDLYQRDIRQFDYEFDS